MKPLLSVAIATKNREQYCIAAIQSILDYNDERIEIAIADNSSSSEIKDFIDKINSNKVKYLYDDGPISSIENFNRAMELTTGEYVCLIGDDDTILPSAVEVANWAKVNNVGSICSNNALHYYWPGARKEFPTGALIVPKLQSKFYKVDVKTELELLIRNGIVNYVFYDLPKTYHGIVKKDIMMRIKELTGSFYGGLSPDIYSVIAVSCLVDEHYITSIPLSIAGVCATSTSAENFTGKHAGELASIPHLKNRGQYIWDKNIPEYYSVSTIWGESGLKALKDLNFESLYKAFNPYPLLAQGVLMNRKHILQLTVNKTVLLRKQKNINQVIFWSKFIFASYQLLIEKIGRTVKLKLKTEVVENVQDISKAVENVLTYSEYKINIQENFNIDNS